jgi:hypothetical protein
MALLSSAQGGPHYTLSSNGLFPPPNRSGHVDGKDPISLRKLEAGNTQWVQSKELLGFVFDGQSRTVNLTQRKALGITEAIT